MTEIKQIKGGTDNCYLVADGRKAILVDTASKQNLDQVTAECDKYEMKLIVLTHVHFDHGIGFKESLMECDKACKISS